MNKNIVRDCEQLFEVNYMLTGGGSKKPYKIRACERFRKLSIDKNI